MPSLSPGKARGLRRISDGEGRYAVLAIDQRPPIFDFLTDERGFSPAEAQAHAGNVKRIIARALAPDVSGVLIDPLYGYDPVLPELPRHTGLLLTLEDHAFNRDPAGHRRSNLIASWDAERAVRAGAEAMKFLVWYREDAPEEAKQRQQTIVREVGEACARVDRPYVLEILPYELPDESFKAYAERLPSLHQGAVETFAAPEYHVDLFKLALPGHVEAVREWGGDHYTLEELETMMRATTSALEVDWVLLSAGVSGAQFEQALEAALRAGARGYMAGRALWREALASYPDAAAMTEVLEGVRSTTLSRLNRYLHRHLAPRTLEAEKLFG